MAKKVLITGVAGGIGLETAKLFLAKGWEVIGTDIKEMAEALDINFIQGDISDEANSKIIFDSSHFTVEGAKYLGNKIEELKWF